MTSKARWAIFMLVVLVIASGGASHAAAYDCPRVSDDWPREQLNDDLLRRMLLDSPAAARTRSEEETGERSRPPMAVAVETNGEDVSLVPHGQSVRQWGLHFCLHKAGLATASRPGTGAVGACFTQNLTERSNFRRLTPRSKRYAIIGRAAATRIEPVDMNRESCRKFRDLLMLKSSSADPDAPLVSCALAVATMFNRGHGRGDFDRVPPGDRYPHLEGLCHANFR